MSSAMKHVPIPSRGVDYRGKVVLAPMVRSGECPSRLLALHYGADLVWGPETVDKAIIGTTRRQNPRTKAIEFCRYATGHKDAPHAERKESVIYRLDPTREGNRLIYQIGTADPDLAVQAATLVAPDVAGIDVNAGCPKPFSTSGGMGAALLKTPDKLCAILEALVKHVGVPFDIGISVKIRILDTSEATAELVKRLVATGIIGLTVHCRTTPMRPRERAIRDQLAMVAQICRDAGVACLMNGDVTSRDEANTLAKEFGADGAMIATAAEKNPSCFRSAAEGGILPWKEVVTFYLKTAMELENRWGNTKYLLGQMIPGKASEYRSVTQAKSYTEIVSVLGVVSDLGDLAKAADAALGLDKPPPAKLSKAARKAAAKDLQAADERQAPGIKRKADEAGLDTDAHIGGAAPGTIPEHASVLVV